MYVSPKSDRHHWKTYSVIKKHVLIICSLIRRMGRVGRVRVYYQTFVPTDVDDIATGNEDFVSFSSHVDFAENEVR